MYAFYEVDNVVQPWGKHSRQSVPNSAATTPGADTARSAQCAPTAARNTSARELLTLLSAPGQVGL